jgi:hypothetical protein
MPVDSRHKEYDATTQVGSRLRDVLAGHDAMVAGGGRYPARLQGQTESEYAAFQ